MNCKTELAKARSNYIKTIENIKKLKFDANYKIKERFSLNFRKINMINNLAQENNSDKNLENLAKEIIVKRYKQIEVKRSSKAYKSVCKKNHQLLSLAPHYVMINKITVIKNINN